MIIKKFTDMNESVGIPEGIFEWVYFFSDIITEQTFQFIKEIKEKGIEEFASMTEIEGVDYKSLSATYDAELDDINEQISTKISETNKIKLKNVYISFDMTIISNKQFSFDYFNAYYDDQHAYFDEDGYLCNATIYFDIYLPKKIMNVDDIDELSKKFNKYKIKRYIYGAIGHEMTHSYEFLRRKISDTEEFDDRITNLLIFLIKSESISDISDDWKDFLNLIYLSLSFEINARVTQVYMNVSEVGVEDKQKYMKAVKKTDPWKDMISLKNFDADEFYENFKVNLNNEEIKKALKDVIDFKEGEDERINKVVLKYLITVWNNYIDVANKHFKKKQLKKLPEKMLQEPLLFLKYYELKFHKNADKFFKKVIKMIADF